jgi:hypothetical protein
MATVKVKVAVAVDKNGKWGCCGWDSDDENSRKQMMGLASDNMDASAYEVAAYYWITADLEIPDGKATEVAAAVEPGQA